MAYTSANEYLQALEQILKKNRGTRVNTLYDTASNVPDQLQTALPIPLKKQEDNTLEPDSIDQLQFDIPQNRPITQPSASVLGSTSSRRSPPYINYDAQGNPVALPEIPEDFEFQKSSDALQSLPKDENGNVLYGPYLPSRQVDIDSLTPSQRRSFGKFIQSWNDGTYGTPEDMQYITANDPTGENFKKYMFNQIKNEDPSMTNFKDGQSLDTADEYLAQARRAMESGDYEAANLYADLAKKLIDFSRESNTEVSGMIPQESQDYPQPQQQPKTENQQNIFSGIADIIDTAKPTGDYGVGGTELLRGDIPGAGKELSRTIEKLNLTGKNGIGFSEMLAGDPEAAKREQRQTAQNIGQGVASIGKSAGLPEMGFSEAISQIPNLFNKPVYAAEMGKLQEKPQANVFSNLLAQAGQGVSNLKNEFGSFMNENIFKKKDLSSMGQKNVIGEDTGGAIASNIGDIKSTPADNRNAFFKAGGLDTYKDQLSPGVTSGYRGALNTNLFSDKFYENPDNVANVFGNTAMGGEATGKYRSYMGKQYPVVEGLSPTTKKSEQYLGSYDGLTVDGEYWKDVFMRQGKDVNSGEGKSFQERERQNQQTYSWDEPNQAYYDNEYNRSIMQSIPNVLQSDFKFTAPRTGETKYGGMSSPQGLYQPVKNDTTGDDKYKDARSIPQMPSSNVFKPQGQIQSIPQVLGASINKPTIPKPVPTPQMSRPQAPAPNSSYNGKSVYNPPPAPSRPQAPSPNSSYNGKSVYNPPPAPSRPAPVPTPKPAPRPANNQSNVFQNLINYLLRR